LQRDARSRKENSGIRNDKGAEGTTFSNLTVATTTTTVEKVAENSDAITVESPLPISPMESSSNNRPVIPLDSGHPSKDPKSALLQDDSSVGGDHATVQQKKCYHQLEMNTRLLEEEVAELKGGNKSSPILPVFLSPPMAYQARCLGILPPPRGDTTTMKGERRRKIHIDDKFAREWAIVLKQSMARAETDRDNEEMRPMAYTLMPEVWSRLRPEPQHQPFESVLDGTIPTDEVSLTTTMTMKAALYSIDMRPFSSRRHHDQSLILIFECLYQRFPKLHLSCGIKFGCDYLLYDGSRNHRHGFAGLMVVVVSAATNTKKGDSSRTEEEEQQQQDVDCVSVHLVSGTAINFRFVLLLFFFFQA